jgi:ligand-binding SRPBCC domain-containing protein
METWVPVAPEKVFPFFAAPENLDALTPPWLDFRILTARPIEMRAGAVIEYRISLHGVPLRWQTEITEWDPPRRFVDVQKRGPYRSWRHEHRFETLDGGTVVVDDVQYEVPGWFAEPLVHKLLVRPDLDKLFAYRRRTMMGLWPDGGRAAAAPLRL